ncbi:MAG: hypothetical protein WDO73_22880, partial [Ignavibacteriota bacterium]
MTLRIERIPGKQKTRIRLSGELREGDIEPLKAEIARDGGRVALDLEEVGLIDLAGVRYLNACEDEGVAVLLCAPYIREWMLQERPGKKKRATSNRGR